MADDDTNQGGQWLPSLHRNMTGSETRLWLKVAGLDPDLAWPWIDSHVGPYDAQRAIARGDTVLDVLAQREAAKAEAQTHQVFDWPEIPDTKASEWVRSGFSEQDAAAWEKSGFTPTAAEDWRTHSQLSPHKASVWFKKGFEPSDAKMWLDAGFSSPTSAEKWSDLPADPEDAALWRSAGFSIKSARQWTFMFGPDESIANGGRVHFDASAAVAWSSSGFERGVAEQWILSDFTLDEALRMTAEGQPTPTRTLDGRTADPTSGDELQDSLLRVSWYTETDLTHQNFRVRDIPLIKGLIENNDYQLAWLMSDFDDLGLVVAALAPLAYADYDDRSVSINGYELSGADAPDGEYAFVPSLPYEFPGVYELGSGSASWLPGGPCLMQQYEYIFSLSDIYWVHAEGDSENGRRVVGRFETLKEGLAAAVAASNYFSINRRGKLICELDSWPHEQ